MSSEMGRSRERESLRCPRSRCVYGVHLSSRCVNGDKKETRDGSCVEMETASREAASIEIRTQDAAFSRSGQTQVLRQPN
ncbi:hypothetical protein DY000_02021283 [Brassica cretica]|uniref:Uncharacterized protein n=1 Tax=Brassica cretica TaxID=69181 RepID=A0ABQ7E0R0_BRACR|nr:hypothetical protein DY000_02021283 [Brassica cretica]